MTLPSMHDHQHEFIRAIRAAMSRKKNVIACAPTGSGKSRIAKWILGASLGHEPSDRQSGYALFAVQRRSLVDNIDGVLNAEPEVPHGILMSGTDTAHHHRIQIASIDTLLSWYVADGQYTIDRTYDLIIYDECHAHLSKLHSFLLAHHAKREQLGLGVPWCLGLSATPEAKGLSDVFDQIVSGPTPKWLQVNGFASTFSYMSGTKGHLELLQKRGREFTASSVEASMQGLHGDFVRDWNQHASGRPTIGFFPLRSQAQEAMELLRQAGVEAEYVDGETPDDARQSLYRGLAAGNYDYLANVGVVERGTDIPPVSCVQLCTAVGRKPRYLQMIGRGSRAYPGKIDCLVLDHGANVARHGFWEDDYVWTLDATKTTANQQQTRPTIECPQCGRVYRGGACSACGYEPTKRERRSQGLEFDGGELIEWTPESRPKPVVDSEALFVSMLYRAGYSRQTWKQAIAQYYREMHRRGATPKVPHKFAVAGREYRSIPYGQAAGNRRVIDLYPSLFRKWIRIGENEAEC